MQRGRVVGYKKRGRWTEVVRKTNTEWVIRGSWGHDRRRVG